MSHKSILLVDDDTNTAKSLSTLLESRGYEVQTAFDGTQATRAAHEKHPDLIAMDMDMSGEEGLRIYIDLMFSPEGKYTPVVLLAGEDNQRVAENAIKMGADGFLTKPFKSRELLLMIYSLIGD